jgi:cellulose synthase/poly-beta-1,6-N-acetylglucosamine synthase-like glycosyltransferase
MLFLLSLFWISTIVILYTYAGYPLIIRLLAKYFPKPLSKAEFLPTVTVLIPAFNEEQYIAKKIENTLSLDYPRDKFQIIVAADGSSDATSQIAKSYEKDGVLVNHTPERNGKMAAIVRSMKDVQGEIVVFSDANNMYDVQAIRELVRPFSDVSVGATTGAKLIIEDGRDLSSAEGLYWKYESSIKKHESTVDSCVSSVGEILAVRKSSFVPPIEKIINDDHYIILDILRRGSRVIYVPTAKSYEYVSFSAQDEVTRRIRMNAGLFQTIFMSGKLLSGVRLLFIWQIISHKYFRAFLPFAFVFVFLTNLLVVALAKEQSLFFTGLFCFQVLFYAAALIGNWLKFNGRIGKLLYLPTFLLNSNAATMMGFFNYLTNRQSHIWQRVRR